VLVTYAALMNYALIFSNSRAGIANFDKAPTLRSQRLGALSPGKPSGAGTATSHLSVWLGARVGSIQ
jgi:hypothetical protein